MATLLKDRLLQVRLAKKLRQKEMAEVLSTNLNTYRSWEKGKRTPDRFLSPQIEAAIVAIQIETPRKTDSDVKKLSVIAGNARSGIAAKVDGFMASIRMGAARA